ncbi:MAG TPA: DMT family transporter [Daejeonella sp.]|nr:DMT family transporter [Daejeonella sp.]
MSANKAPVSCNRYSACHCINGLAENIEVLCVTGVIMIDSGNMSNNIAALIVAGQILFALFLDHYGLLGFIQCSVNWMRMAGAILLIAGVFLILKN